MDAPYRQEPEMLHDCLTLEKAVLPGLPAAWPHPFDLAVELNEVLLIEGVDREAGESFVRVAAALTSPAAGQVRHWGRQWRQLSREEVFRLRRKVAGISPAQVLLRRFTLGGNIILGPRCHSGLSSEEVLARYADLLRRLSLLPHLAKRPDLVPEDLYFRALWARELVKEPNLVVALLTGPLRQAVDDELTQALLTDYLEQYGGAVVLLGESLEAFYPLAHRVLRLEAGRLSTAAVPGRRPRPLEAYLQLV